MPEAVIAVVALVALGLYLAAAAVAGGWSRWRIAAWAGGVMIALAGFSAHGDVGPFSGHMAGHLLTGMVAPLLLMLAAPGTLALRALPVSGARRLARLLRTRVVRVVTHPGWAAVIGTITLWLLYGTPAGQAVLHDGRWHAVLHAHLLAAGFLLAWSVAGRDPVPDRPGPATRAVALGVYLAAHAILAKHLYATGTTPADAMLMYYGGDLTHLVLVILVCYDWYRTAQRRQAGRPSRSPARTPVTLPNAPGDAS